MRRSRAFRDGIVDAGYRTLALFNYKKPIYARQFDLLDKAAWPMNLDCIDRGRLPQAEMKPLVIR